MINIMYINERNHYFNTKLANVTWAELYHLLISFCTEQDLFLLLM